MLRIKCPHCEAKARVRTSRPITPITTELALQCQDFECGATFVSHLSVSHMVRPSGKPNLKLVLPTTSRRLRAPAPVEVPPAANDQASDEVLAEG